MLPQKERATGASCAAVLGGVHVQSSGPSRLGFHLVLLAADTLVPDDAAGGACLGAAGRAVNGRIGPRFLLQRDGYRTGGAGAVEAQLAGDGGLMLHLCCKEVQGREEEWGLVGWGCAGRAGKPQAISTQASMWVLVSCAERAALSWLQTSIKPENLCMCSLPLGNAPHQKGTRPAAARILQRPGQSGTLAAGRPRERCAPAAPTARACAGSRGRSGAGSCLQHRMARGCCQELTVPLHEEARHAGNSSTACKSKALRANLQCEGVPNAYRSQKCPQLAFHRSRWGTLQAPALLLWCCHGQRVVRFCKHQIC